MAAGDVRDSPQYEIFISYRQSDAKDAAMAIFSMLKDRYKLRVFYDAQELDSLHDLQALVRKSKAVVPIISPGYLETLQNPQSWCSLEIKTALAAGIPLVPVYDPDKTSIPPQSYINALHEDIQPLFKVLFKAIRREGEYLEVFFKDLLRSAGLADAYVRASADPWSHLDITPRTRAVFRAVGMRFEVGAQLIRELGLSDIDDFKFVDKGMVEKLRLKPLEEAKVVELIMRICEGEWAHLDVKADVAEPPAGVESLGDGTMPPRLSPSASLPHRSSLQMSAMQASALASVNSPTGRGLLGHSMSMTPVRPGAGNGSFSSQQGSPFAGRQGSAGGIAENPSSTLRSTTSFSAAGTTSLSMRSSLPSIVSTLGVLRVTNGDLAELAAKLASAAPATACDLANRTFSAAALPKGMVHITGDGVTLMGGTLLLKKGQKVVVSGKDVLLEDVTITCIGPWRSESSIGEEGEDEEDDDEEDDSSEEESSDDEEEEEEEEEDSEEEEEEDGEEGEEEEEEEDEDEDSDSAPLLEVRDGGSVTLRRVTLQLATDSKAKSMRIAALVLTEGGCASAMDARFGAQMPTKPAGEHSVLISGAGCLLHAEGCVLECVRGTCAVIKAGGAAQLINCTVQRSSRSGSIELEGFGSTLDATATEISATQGVALSVRGGAGAQLADAKLLASDGAEALVVRGRGTRVRAAQSRLSASNAAAARVMQGGVLELQECSVDVASSHKAKRSHAASEQTVVVDDGTLMHDAATTFEPEGPTCTRGGKVETF